MCCAGRKFEREEIDGTFPDCGKESVGGEAYDSCAYSSKQCETCGYAPCDGSC